jgi:hypothetical protein
MNKFEEIAALEAEAKEVEEALCYAMRSNDSEEVALLTLDRQSIMRDLQEVK